MTIMDKDKLAAFVDGELSPEEAARIVLHLADHPMDQAYVDDLYAANEALTRAFSAPLHEPVPEALRAAIMGTSDSKVIPFRPRSRVTVALAGLALAASVIAAAVLLTGLMGGPQAQSIALGPLDATDPVAGVLDNRPSGIVVQFADGRETMVLASYGMADGRFCREIEVVEVSQRRVDYAIGCRAGDVWTIEATIAEIASGDTGQDFVPAGEAELDTLTRFLDRGGASVALDAAAEAEAIRKGWSAP